MAENFLPLHKHLPLAAKVRALTGEDAFLLKPCDFLFKGPGTDGYSLCYSILF